MAPASITSKSAVMAMLKENQNERGIAHWKKKKRLHKSYGIGLTQLRKLAKQIGRDHQLAQKLWKSDYYDAKIIALLNDDPKQVTRDQAEEQVEGLGDGYLEHVFSSCGATLAKVSFAFELACDWIIHEDPIRRRCGYGLVYELSKKNPKGMDDAWCLNQIKLIQGLIHDEQMWVRESMNTALMGLGKRNKTLNRVAIKAVKAMGPVEIDYGDDNACEPLDVLKHLTSDYIKERFSK